MTTDINGGTAGPFNTQIPLLSDNADIQQALRIYHYGSNTSNPSPLPSESIAGHLNTLTNNKIGLPSIISGGSSNLNTYLATGFYYQTSTANARTGTNYPISPSDGLAYAGMLESLATSTTSPPANGALVFQTYMMFDGTNDPRFWRQGTYNSGTSSWTWTSWKTATDQVTGSASTITTANLTADRALITTAGQKVGTSAVTSTELATLTGITTSGSSTIQSQLNTKPTIWGRPGGVSSTISNQRIFVQQLEPNGTNNSGYTPQEGDLWFW